MSEDASSRGGMRPDRTDHFLFEELGDQRMSDARNAAYGPKAGRLMSPTSAWDLRYDISNLEHVARVCEMAAVRQWSQAHGGGEAPGTHPDRDEVRLENLCSWCFGFLEACPVPEHPAAKFSHVLRLFAYAYMGDRWEAMRRYVS